MLPICGIIFLVVLAILAVMAMVLAAILARPSTRYMFMTRLAWRLTEWACALHRAVPNGILDKHGNLKPSAYGIDDAA